MYLKDFIETIGDGPAATLFGVSQVTALSWRLGNRSPRKAKAEEISKLTKGKVSFSECYGVPK